MIKRSYRVTPPCSKCPYKLSLVQTVVNPCPQCKENGYQTFERFQKGLSTDLHKAYALVNTGIIKVLKIGQHYRIPRDEFIDFIKKRRTERLNTGAIPSTRPIWA